LRTFVYGDLPSVFTDSRHVVYCYSGKNKRGSVALFDGDSIIVIEPKNYTTAEYQYEIEDYSGFELWGFIHEMIDDEDMSIREEAVTRFFDIYSGLYQFIPMLQDYEFEFASQY